MESGMESKKIRGIFNLPGSIRPQKCLLRTLFSVNYLKRKVSLR